MKSRQSKAILTGILLTAMMFASNMTWAQNAAAPATRATADTYAASPPPLQGPDLLSVADEYVKVVGGVIAGLGTLLGLPLVYQTFRKTRAEIEKINLESVKLRKDLGEVAPAVSDVSPNAYRIAIDGNDNQVSILTDPRWAAPLLVLVDAFIAGIFSTVASYAVGLLPLPYIIEGPIRLIVYLAIFYPVFIAALQVKKNLGSGLRQLGDRQPEPKENSL